jgi:hypothetical protein
MIQPETQKKLDEIQQKIEDQAEAFARKDWASGSCTGDFIPLHSGDVERCIHLGVVRGFKAGYEASEAVKIDIFKKVVNAMADHIRSRKFSETESVLIPDAQAGFNLACDMLSSNLRKFAEKPDLSRHKVEPSDHHC